MNDARTRSILDAMPAASRPNLMADLFNSQAMSSVHHPVSALPQRWWFLALLAAYAVLELSFNHRLLEMASSAAGADRAKYLSDMEVWARLVSGMGLALVLMRFFDKRIPSRLLLLVSCSLAGLLLMWQLQKAVVDAIVARADEPELRMSAHGYLTTAEALKGRIELRGKAVLMAPASDELRPVFEALWSSTVLGLEPQDLEPTAGAMQLSSLWFALKPSADQQRQTYRMAVMTPVALGSSLLFGLLNLCQLFSGLIMLVLDKILPLHRPRPGGWMLIAWLSLCLILSWFPANAWVDSPGYRGVARPALWENQPLLAPFVEWSLRAEPAWVNPVAWMHRKMLADFDFRKPWQELQ